MSSIENNTTSGSSSTKRKRDSQNQGNSKKPKLSTAPTNPEAVAPFFNLTGRSDTLKAGSFKTIRKKIAYPINSTNLATDSCWKFAIRSAKNEFIRFFPDSISILIYGTINRTPDPPPPAGEDDERTEEQKARVWALRASQGEPFMFLDPTAEGTGFARDVRVTINGQTVPIHHSSSLQQYVRVNRILNDKPSTHFNYTTDWVRVDGEGRALSMTPALKKATSFFDYVSWDSLHGTRARLCMDNIFPFDSSNRTIQAIDRQREMSKFLPPETLVEVEIFPHAGNMANVHHANVTSAATYFSNEAVESPNPRPNLTFQEICITYESGEMYEQEFVRAMRDYSDPHKYATYGFDLVHEQKLMAPPAQAFFKLHFTIPRFCRLVYLLFLPSHATLYMDTLKKPLSGYSRFLENCTSMRVHFAGHENLVCSPFERFGDYDEVHQVRIFFKNMRLTLNH